MRQRRSPSTGRRYPLTMICATYRLARSSVYAGPSAAPRESTGKRGPKTVISDVELVTEIRAVLAACPSHGEGYRKVCLDIGDDALCAWSVTREVHDDVGTGGCHRLRDAGSNALGRAGDERNLTSQGTGHQRVLQNPIRSSVIFPSATLNSWFITRGSGNPVRSNVPSILTLTMVRPGRSVTSRTSKCT